jgi:acetoin utilization protein AcuB
MLVRDRMTPNPICGHPDMPVTEAQELMMDRGIRHLPIVDDDGKLVGLITQRSLLRALPSDMSHFSRFEVSYVLAKIKAREVMVRDVLTVGEGTALEEAARVMADRKLGCLPVMRGDDLVGIITDNDVFTIMVDLLGARRPGVRVTILVPDRVGEVARITTAIARAGGYLSVFVAYPATPDMRIWAAVCKVTGVPRDQLVAVIEGLEDAEIEDIREI